MNSDKKRFRKSFRGYNKKDVNEYISKENAVLIETRKGLQNELDLCQEELAKLEAALESERIKTKELSEKLDERDNLIEAYKSDKDTLSERLEELEEKVESLKSAEELSLPVCEPYSDDSVLEKARSYDSLRSRIDEILSYAKSEAEQIIKEAGRSVSDLEIKRVNEVSKFKQDISNKSSSIINDLRSLFKKYTR